MCTERLAFDSFETAEYSAPVLARVSAQKYKTTSKTLTLKRQQADIYEKGKSDDGHS